MIWGHAAGNDLTRRDLQAEAKASRRPWDMAKGFDKSAVVGAIRPGALPEARLRCSVNGAVRQEASAVGHGLDPGSDHRGAVPDGQPVSGRSDFHRHSGRGRPLNRGDTCKVEIEGLQSATVTIA